jgi:hypothetical protein
VGLSICVFCASASGLPEVYRRAARELGGELARRGHRLVYGGGDVGLMREVARSVHRHGGTIFGAIPRSLVDRELAYGPTDELVVTDTLRERKDTFPVNNRDGGAHEAQAALRTCRSAVTYSPQPDRRPASASRPPGRASSSPSTLCRSGR